MSEENIIFCPLECGARIKYLGKHIQKCKNYNLLGVKFRLCEYNNAHIIKNELYQTHLLSCNSRIISKENDEDDSIDDDLSKKFSDSSENENEKEEENKEKDNNVNESKELDNKNKNDENNINKKKRRYRHERALFKNENEIDQECLSFFKKVYV